MNYSYEYSVYDHDNAESREYNTLDEARATAKKWKAKGHRVELTYEKVDLDGNVETIKSYSI